MGVLDTTYTFTATDVVTSAKLNNVIDQTTFTATAITGTTLAINSSGQLKVNANGITPMEVSSGNYAINVTGSSASCTGNAATATNATTLNSQNSSFYTDIPARLGFTPVQQGGGNSQFGNKIYIGWSAASQLRLQVDSTDFGSNFPISITGNAGSAIQSYNGNFKSYGNGGNYDSASFVAQAAGQCGYGMHIPGVSGCYIQHLSGTPGIRVLNQDGTGTQVRAGQFIDISSIKFKENVQPLNDALSIVENLQGVTFDWKESGEPSVGFIAEQVYEVLPSVVALDVEGLPEGVEYSKITAILVESVKQLSARVKALESAVI